MPHRLPAVGWPSCARWTCRELDLLMEMRCILRAASGPASLRESHHRALFSEVTCHAISSDWCHDRCQEESIDSAGFSIFNGVNGHLLSSDATAALFQMEAHVTPRLIMPATSREARAQCP
ncbi:hypothetical protein Q8A67_024203 [Cirrhinus molitorella]|uniref:Uncharacterized protein n=1 Tax=Cirrhinus molitorella TaxID=172907 RepID=A0AA88NY41_9TELE|nr:hypothetical protein Q8A67_024203 [Cirrhinus molitorella]